MDGPIRPSRKPRIREGCTTVGYRRNEIEHNNIEILYYSQRTSNVVCDVNPIVQFVAETYVRDMYDGLLQFKSRNKGFQDVLPCDNLQISTFLIGRGFQVYKIPCKTPSS